MTVTLAPKTNVLSGLRQKYTPKQMNGYVMYKLDPTPAPYSEVHVTRSVDVTPANTGSWDHVTFQNGAAASVRVYFHLQAGEYVTKMLGTVVATPAQQVIAKECIWDLQLVGILPHSQSFTANLEQQRLAREEAKAAAEAESARLAEELSARIRDSRASGAPAWGKSG